MSRADSLAFLGALADAAGGTHRPRSLARAVAQVMASHGRLAWLELGRVDRAAGRVTVTRCGLRRGAVAPAVEEERRIASSVHAAPRTAAIVVTPIGHTEARSPLDEPRRAARTGASHLVVMTFDDDEMERFVALALGPGPSWLLAPEVLDAARRVLGAALRGQEVVERVAALSRRAHRESRAFRDELSRAQPDEDLVVAGAAMGDVLELADLVAAQPTTVLLRGETGTGKELLARRIHRLSPRATHPFLRINCGALPEGLVESALFGHERGAFTGAAARHRGVFERAHGGTLLLDEVAELPPPAQVKLLRVLQEGEVVRVGAEESLRVDVRVLAATHRPLEEWVARGRFREDLYYRLNIFPLTLPPLRERLDELPILVERLVARISARLLRPAPEIPRGAITRLAQHAWPGNIRELENLLERALVLHPPSMRGARRPLLVLPRDFVGTRPGAARVAPRLVGSYASAMRDCIGAALAACDGRIYGPTGAAALLELKPTTLQSKMRKLGITRD